MATDTMTGGPGGRDKTTEIFVNGKRRTVAGKKISYDTIVGIAYDGNPPTAPGTVITVTYSRAKGHKESGTLVAGQSVALHDGMVFTVDDTTES